MNKTKIEWCDYTWNPVTGCLHGCKYCYAEKISKRFTGDFKPKFHEKRFKPNKLEGKNIFVCSMSDLFGDWVPKQWILDVLDYVSKDQKNNYFILTKNPKRYKEFFFYNNCYVGFSASTQADYDKRTKEAGKVDFVSFEPIQGEIDILTSGYNLDWAIIGAESGNRKEKATIEKEWVYELMMQCDCENIPVFLKDNIGISDLKLQEHIIN